MKAKLQPGCDCLGKAEAPPPATSVRLLSLAPRKHLLISLGNVIMNELQQNCLGL